MNSNLNDNELAIIGKTLMKRENDKTEDGEDEKVKIE